MKMWERQNVPFQCYISPMPAKRNQPRLVACPRTYPHSWLPPFAPTFSKRLMVKYHSLLCLFKNTCELEGFVGKCLLVSRFWDCAHVLTLPDCQNPFSWAKRTWGCYLKPNLTPEMWNTSYIFGKRQKLSDYLLASFCERKTRKVAVGPTVTHVQTSRHPFKPPRKEAIFWDRLVSLSSFADYHKSMEIIDTWHLHSLQNKLVSISSNQSTIVSTKIITAHQLVSRLQTGVLEDDDLLIFVCSADDIGQGNDRIPSS
jgi:hypothetical protein